MTHSDVSGTMSGQVPSENTETSQAPSLPPSLPHRDQADGDEQGQAEEHKEPIDDKEHRDRGSNESVGSGSSFEELDLVEEMVEELERELGREEEGLMVEEGAQEAP